MDTCKYSFVFLLKLNKGNNFFIWEEWRIISPKYVTNFLINPDQRFPLERKEEEHPEDLE